MTKTTTTKIEKGVEMFFVLYAGTVKVEMFATITNTEVGYSARTRAGGVIRFNEANIEQVIGPNYEGDTASIFLKIA